MCEISTLRCRRGFGELHPSFFVLALILFVAASARDACAQTTIPDNDSFATRTPLFGSSPGTTARNTGATFEPGEPDPSFQGEKSVWWTWTAPTNGSVTITTAGSSFDTILTVFTGSALTNLVLVAFNDTETNTSIVNFNVSAGTAYQIAVDGANGDEGNISLQLSMGPTQTPPVNDNFINRVTISGTHLSNVTGSNVGATAEPGEPFHADQIGQKSVWWTWTAPSSGGLTLTTQGSSIDTLLAIYTGDPVSNLTFVAANDEDPLSIYTSRIMCNVTAGTIYQIAVDGFEGDAGDIRLRLDLNDPFPVPANDNFANRITLTGSNISTNVTNVGASYEPGEPIHLVTLGGKSVWWQWTAPASGGVTLTASNNLVDTLVCVYKGTSVSNLTFVAGNDEDFLTDVEGDSTAYFNVTAGTTYQIVVDGVDGSSGIFRLSLVLGAADPVPANDNFANRILLSGSNVTTTNQNLGATLEPGEPLHHGYYGGKSVWWRWTSPGTGFVTIDTIGSLFDTILAVYTGSTLTNLVEVASDDESGGNYTSLVTFPTASNVTYQIAVDGYDGDSYDLTLHIHFTAASYALGASANPPASGTASISPLPDQNGKYIPGSVVTLTATPADGAVFTSWSGSVTSTNNPLVLTMNSNKTLVAGFYFIPTNKVWTGASAASGNWADGANWIPRPPSAGDFLIFPAGASRLTSNTNDLPANSTVGSITFGGAGYILGGNTVNLEKGIFCTNATGTNAITLGLQLNADLPVECSNATAGLEFAGNLNLSNRTMTVRTVGQILVSGAISGNGSVVKTNLGTLSFIGTGANSYTGSTLVSEGILALGKTGVAVTGPLTVGDGSGGADADVVRVLTDQQISSASSVTINSSGLLELIRVSNSVGSLVGNGHVALTGAAAALSVGLDNSSTAFNGLVTGAGSLAKAGSGTLILNADNTYNGPTLISLGQLVVKGSQPASSVTINPMATLAGTGRVGNISVDGTLSPGLSPGILSCSQVTFSSNSTFRVELNGPNPGTDYDQLKVAGNVNVAGNLDATLGFALVTNTTFNIIDNQGSQPVIGTFKGLPEGSFLVINGTQFQISYMAGAASNDVVLIGNPRPTISVNVLADGSPQLHASGQTNNTYVIESANALNPPVSWFPLTTNTVDSSGGYYFIDTNGVAAPMRFYRMRQQ